MKVIFIVQGEGRGHLTQALTLEKMLRDKGHEVVEILVGKSKAREIPSFFYAKTQAPVVKFDSPNFLPSRSQTGVSVLGSTFYNLFRLPKYLRSILLIRKHLKDIQPDMVINFYEILGNVCHQLFRPAIPEVCIGHQYMFLHPDFTFPQVHRHSQEWMKVFTEMTCMGAQKVLALSLRKYHHAEKEGITVVPPLLRNEILSTPRHHGNYITGYMLNPGFSKYVMQWHEKHPKVCLHFYWDKKDAPEVTQVDSTLSFHQINDEAFIRDLANCKAYATTGGFESVCKAMYMGKPVIMAPVHVEQECNAFEAQQEGAGVMEPHFDLDRLLAFAQDYTENVEFRIWENQAEEIIVNAIEAAYDTYHAPTVTYSPSKLWQPLLPWGNFALSQ